MEKCFDSLSQRISVAENLVKYLVENPMEISSPPRNLVSVVGTETLRKSSEDYGAFKEGKKRKLAPEEEKSSSEGHGFFKMRQKVLDEHLVPLTEHVEWLGVTLAGDQSTGKKLEEDLDSREMKLRAADELLTERERKVRMVIETLDERISAVEESERKFYLFLEENRREMELKEEQLWLKWEDFAEQVKLADAKFRQQEKLKNAVLKKLELAENKLETMRADMDARINEVEFRENASWKWVALSVSEADLIWESMEKLVEEFEKMRSEFNSFQEDKMRELDAKEQLLIEINEELIKSATLRNDQLIERERSMNLLLEKLELAKDNVEGLKVVVDERYKKVLLKEIEVNSQSDWTERKMDEIDAKEKQYEKRKSEFNSFQEDKMRELDAKEQLLNEINEELVKSATLRNDHLIEWERSVNQHLEKLELAKENLEVLKVVVDEKIEKVLLKEIELKSQSDWIKKKIDETDAKSKEFEKRKSEFHSFQEDKMREWDSKEQLLNEINEELVKSATLRNNQLIERERSVNQLLKKLELAKDNVEGLKVVVYERLKKVWLKESELNSLSDWIEKKMDEIDSKSREFEKMKSEFNSFQEDKMQELGSKEQLLIEINEELVKSATFMNDQLLERERSVNQLLEKLELAKDNVEGLKVVVVERFKKMSLKEIELNSQNDWIEKKKDEIDAKAQEFEKMESEFYSFQKDKMRELDSKEQLLNEINDELFKSATLRNDQLIEWERSVNHLCKKLELAKDKVEGLKVVVDGRLKKLLLKEIELNSRSDSIEKQMDEIDARAKELEEKDRMIKMKEDKRTNKEIELAEKEKTLDKKDKNLKSVGEFVNSCFKKYLAKKRKLLLEKDLVEKTARFLGIKEENLDHALRELEFREKQMDQVEEEDLEHQRPFEPDESVDLKFTVRMDGKNLQMFLNDSEKDLESMNDEIFKVLHLSSDPAKLVLEALEGFYPPHLRDSDMVFNVRRTCISLLKQLVRMSSKIKPHVREEAFQLASTWKSKIRPSANSTDPLEVLGFLFLLAAYNLASCFCKDDITSLLKMVAQLREAPELYNVLGFRWSTTGVKAN